MVKKARKKYKTIKCANCNERLEIIDEEVEVMDGYKFIICPYCGVDILLGKVR